MSQSSQSNVTAPAPAGTSQEADTLVDAYAEDLMDEIFDDVDRILAGKDTAIYADPIEQSQGASTLLSSAAVTVPAMIVPVTADPSVDPRASITEGEARFPQTDVRTDAQKTSSVKSGGNRRWGKFLLGAVCVSALTAAGIWWMRQQPTLQTATAPSAPTTPAVSQEVAFGEYLKRSLRVIGGERSAQTETQSSSAVATDPAKPAAERSQTASGPATNNVIERVFVPLLQPGSNSNQGTPSNVVTLPSLPKPDTAAPGQSDSTAPVPNIATGSTYELVGVLELGDRSAALFEVDGSSQRVYIGETIGGSGWSIVSISDEEVVVRRNGEVRSIYIGQQF